MPFGAWGFKSPLRHVVGATRQRSFQDRCSGDGVAGGGHAERVVELGPVLRVRRQRARSRAPRSVYVSSAGLSLDADRNVLIANYGFTLSRITPNGQLQTMHAFVKDEIPGLGGGFRPTGVAAAPDGSVYLVDDGRGGGSTVGLIKGPTRRADHASQPMSAVACRCHPLCLKGPATHTITRTEASPSQPFLA